MFSGITSSHVGARTLLYNREDAHNGATNTRNANMDRPIWFVDAPLWFVDTSFCISNTQHLLKIASISTLFA